MTSVCTLKNKCVLAVALVQTWVWGRFVDFLPAGFPIKPKILGHDRVNLILRGRLTTFVSAICASTRCISIVFDTINNGRHWGTFAMNVTSRLLRIENYPQHQVLLDLTLKHFIRQTLIFHCEQWICTSYHMKTFDFSWFFTSFTVFPLKKKQM